MSPTTKSRQNRAQLLAINLFEGLKIILFAILAAITYGILHDQVTARISVEYFTIGHERIFNTEDPTLLAFGWGVIATWWVGLSLGIPLAIACRFGSKPKFTWRDIAKPIVIMLAISGMAALVAGIGHYYGNLSGPMLVDHRMPGLSMHRFEAVHRAHITSYECGFLGGLIVILNAWYRRAKREREAAAKTATPTPLSMLNREV